MQTVAQRRPVTALIETARRWTSRTERAEHAAFKEEQRIHNELLDLPAGWFVLDSDQASRRVSRSTGSPSLSASLVCMPMQ